METAPNLIYAGGRMHAKEPGGWRGRPSPRSPGARGGAMFFQWRAPRGGAELFHSALVPHAGPDSRVYREAVALGETLGRIAEVSAGRGRGAGGDRLRRAVGLGAAGARAAVGPGSTTRPRRGGRTGRSGGSASPRT